MRRNVIVMTVALVYLVFNTGSGCYKHADFPLGPPAIYDFEASVDIYPLQKTYHLTDTIWLEADISSKFLWEKNMGISINADSNELVFDVMYTEFGNHIASPANGFCDIITPAGVNLDVVRSLFTTEEYYKYGCSEPSYRCRIGFKPNYTGNYRLELPTYVFTRSCPGKTDPYIASLSFTFKDVDLNLDVFNAMPDKDKGKRDDISNVTGLIAQKKAFVFRCL